MTPQSIGRYTVRRELGHGAMGVVYEAEDPNIGRTVALKVVRTDQIGANREEVVRRFKNEARAAGNLSHPNIITIHDAGEHEGMLYIAMECVQGATLADVMAQQGRMPPGKVVDIIRQICLGLDFAHRRGIIHRDIKPANILISDSLVKITDFGIANVGDGMTITGTVVGTPNYMSPEQVLGKPLDGRSDLFSVGVMLYEMVTGERPFEGQSITTIMYKIVHEDPIAPRKLDSSIHPGLSTVVEKALAKSPEGRFQTGAELATALENYTNTPVGPATFGNLATADLPPLPETATLTRAQTAAYAPPTISPSTTQQVPPPEKKSRGFWYTFMLGCFGVIVVGILAITVITLVAMHAGKRSKAPAAEVNRENPEGQPKSPAQAAPTEPGKVTEVSPPKPAKTKATLKLDSTPPGAAILLDGDPTHQTTPATIAIGRGTHTVAISMAGFKTASAKFKVSGGEEFEFAPELSVDIPAVNVPNVPMPDIAGIVAGSMSQLKNLQRRPGLSVAQKEELEAISKWNQMRQAGEVSILVNSHPAGARILIDGNDSGKKTPAVISVDAGTHTVRLELEGQPPFEKNVKVSKDIPAAVTAHFGATNPAQPPPAPAPPK